MNFKTWSITRNNEYSIMIKGESSGRYDNPKCVSIH